MPNYEYQVVSSPRKSKSVRKIRGNDAKFANTISVLMNEMASEGWEYQRAETLPCEERQGLTGKTIKYHSMLVFRREVEADVVDVPVVAIAAMAAPVVTTPVIPAPAQPAPAQRAEPVITRTEGPASEGFLSNDSSDKPDDRNETAAQ